MDSKNLFPSVWARKPPLGHRVLPCDPPVTAAAHTSPSSPYFQTTWIKPLLTPHSLILLAKLLITSSPLFIFFLLLRLDSRYHLPLDPHLIYFCSLPWPAIPSVVSQNPPTLAHILWTTISFIRREAQTPTRFS